MIRPLWWVYETSWLVLVLALMTTSVLAAPPQIGSLSESTLMRSGRLEILGSDFGVAQGTSQVLIGGLQAIVTTWSESEIHAYVPEQTPLGIVAVQVTAAAGTSNSVMLDVTPRQESGRIRWKFEMDSPFPGWFTAVAADGTIYASDYDQLYALSPDGALLWVSEGAGRERAIDIGAEGTIYAAGYTGAGIVRAINPDGSLRWAFVPPTLNLNLLAGPNVGPDGNIYAVQDQSSTGEGLGFFCLDPEGKLLWSTDAIVSATLNNTSIKFAQDRFYVGLKTAGSSAPPNIHAVSLEGDPLWTAGELFIPNGAQPQADASGRVISVTNNAMQAITPDGDVDWFTPHPTGGYILNLPAVDLFGNSYTSGWIGNTLWSLDPNGGTRWALSDGSSDTLFKVGVSPDGNLLLAAGGPTPWIRGYDTTDGSLLWQVDVPSEDGLNQFVESAEQSFSADSQTAYVTTVFGAAARMANLFAIRTGPESVSPPGSSNGLTIGKSGDLLDLGWNASCGTGAVDYAVYEGTRGDWTSHMPAVCSTGGATSATLTPGPEDRYFLVVPLGASVEGGYGSDSGGGPRGVSAGACLPSQLLGSCP